MLAFFHQKLDLPFSIKNCYVAINYEFIRTVPNIIASNHCDAQEGLQTFPTFQHLNRNVE